MCNFHLLVQCQYWIAENGLEISNNNDTENTLKIVCLWNRIKTGKTTSEK